MGPHPSAGNISTPTDLALQLLHRFRQLIRCGVHWLGHRLDCAGKAVQQICEWKAGIIASSLSLPGWVHSPTAPQYIQYTVQASYVGNSKTTENWPWNSVGHNSSWLSGCRSQDKLNAEGSTFKQQKECGNCYANKIFENIVFVECHGFAVPKQKHLARHLPWPQHGILEHVGCHRSTGQAFWFHSRIDDLYCFRTALFEGLIRQSLRIVMQQIAWHLPHAFDKFGSQVKNVKHLP